jgi:hypothetical protein
MSDPDYSNIVRLLADFGAYLWPNSDVPSAQEFFSEHARKFLAARGTTCLVDPPPHHSGTCDLCGRAFEIGPTTQHEPFTGNNYLWCPECYNPQLEQVAYIGKKAYRAYWQAQEEVGLAP